MTPAPVLGSGRIEGARVEGGVNDLVDTRRTALDVEDFLHGLRGAARSDVKTSNPELRAWFVDLGGRSFFVKWAKREFFDETLRKDAEICSLGLHPAIVRLYNVLEARDGTALVFEKIEGTPLIERQNRGRFNALPVAEKMRALRSIFGAIDAIAGSGYVVVDFYEGNVIYDFAHRTVKIHDFELFERGEGFTLKAQRNYGSTRLMAPEEFIQGSWIDGRTNVFQLGRYAICALSDRAGEDWREGFRCSPELANILLRATRPDPAERHPSVKRFWEEFDAATVDVAAGSTD